MSNTNGSEFYEAAHRGLALLSDDMHNRIDGRIVNGPAYVMTLPDYAFSDIVTDIWDVNRLLYPHSNESNPHFYSREAHMAISGMVLALHAVQSGSPEQYEQVTGLLNDQLQPPAGLSVQQGGAQRMEAAGQSTLNQLGITPDTDIPFYGEIAWDQPRRLKFDGAFGYVLSLLGKATQEDTPSGLDDTAPVAPLGFETFGIDN